MQKPSAPKNAPDYFPLVAHFLLALFLFSYPWLSLFNHRMPVLGIPLVLLYLFGLWGLLILVSALTRAGP